MNTFVSIGDEFAKDIQTVDTLSPTRHITHVSCKFRFKSISASQVTKIMKKLLNGKATGVHGIPNKALKDSTDIIAPSLIDIFNFSVETKVFPNEMKVGKVAPVYKSEEIDDLNNYRPISVLPTAARVFEKILYIQIYDYFTTNKLLGNQ